MFEIHNNKTSRRKGICLEGQMSLWDIEPQKDIVETPKIIKHIAVGNKEDIIEKYKSIASRIILMGEGFMIEIPQEAEFKTVYVNKKDEEEFEFNRRAPVHPFNSIIYAKEDIYINELQKERLKNIKGDPLKRFGDSSIVIKNEDKVVCINEKGWVLEYKDIKLADEESFKKLILEQEPKEAASFIDVNIGDLVQTTYGQETIIASGLL